MQQWAKNVENASRQIDAAQKSGDANAQASAAHRGLERVNGDVLSLYNQVVNADAAPTRAQQSAAEPLLQEWKSLAAAATKIWQDDVAALNQALTRARLPALRSDAAAPEEGESSDEE